jgi:hypothetical protein
VIEDVVRFDEISISSTALGLLISAADVRTGEFRIFRSHAIDEEPADEITSGAHTLFRDPVQGNLGPHERSKLDTAVPIPYGGVTLTVAHGRAEGLTVEARKSRFSPYATQVFGNAAR